MTLSAINVEIQKLINLSTSLQSELNITCECLKGEINKTTEEKLKTRNNNTISANKT